MITLDIDSKNLIINHFLFRTEILIESGNVQTWEDYDLCSLQAFLRNQSFFDANNEEVKAFQFYNVQIAFWLTCFGFILAWFVWCLEKCKKGFDKKRKIKPNNLI